MKTECDYLNGWIKKRSHTQKSHPKAVNPRDIAGEHKKKKKKMTWDHPNRLTVMQIHVCLTASEGIQPSSCMHKVAGSNILFSFALRVKIGVSRIEFELSVLYLIQHPAQRVYNTRFSGRKARGRPQNTWIKGVKETLSLYKAQTTRLNRV